MKFYLMMFAFLIISTNLVGAIEIGSDFYNNNGEIRTIDAYSYIKDDKLYSTIFIEGAIKNKSLIENPDSYIKFYLTSREGYGGKPMSSTNLLICNGLPNNIYRDYKDVFFECNEIIESTLYFSEDNRSLKFIFNSSRLSTYTFL